MRSTFYGLEIAKTGLFTAQKSLDVAGHNISNADTVGYSRQRLSTASIPPAALNVFIKEDTRGLAGRGVEVQFIEQIRSPYLDFQYRKENSTTNYWAAKESEFEHIEGIFNTELEPLIEGTTNASLSAVFSKFYRSLYSLTQNPAGDGIRQNVIENAGSLCQTFNDYARRLNEQQDNLDTAIKMVTGEINDIASEIADLNELIYGYELTGDRANDLRDKRNLLLDELSGKARISWSEDNKGRLVVELGGRALVEHNMVTKLTALQVGANSLNENRPIYRVYWTNQDGKPLADFDVRGLAGKGIKHDPNLPGLLDTGEYSVKYLDLNDPDNPGSFQLIDSRGRVVQTVKAQVDDGTGTMIDWDGTASGASVAGAGVQDLTLAFNGVGTFTFSIGDFETHECDEATPGNFTVKNSAIAKKLDEMFNGVVASVGEQLDMDGLEGELKGYMDMRDGDSEDNVGVPRMMHLLDQLCQKIVRDFNEVHRQGWTKPSELLGEDSMTGLNFFEDASASNDWDNVNDARFVTALNFTLSGDIDNNVNRIAASSEKINSGEVDKNQGNQENALKLCALIFNRDDIGNPDNFNGEYMKIIAITSSTLQQIRRTSTSQKTVLSQLDLQRASIMNVSLDEEMASVITFRHAYNAASRMITAIDEQIDTIVNKMGLVGR